ncbi:hypothetical protein GGS24DRAFT_467193 [Hypoxylon argillaceum]|nr:hypothetical protein GGS24DRAFT_467193 [Hypoxylon argillaceum]
MRHSVPSSSTPELVGQRQGTELRGTASTQNPVDPQIWSAGAALVFGALACHLSSRPLELTSELLCWVLLPAVFGIAKPRRSADKHAKALPLISGLMTESDGDGGPSAVSLWLVAASIAIVSVFRAERGIIVLFPALAPLLIICHRYLRPGLSPHAISHMSFPNNILGTSLSAMFATLALSEWDLLAYATSVIPVVALFVAYTLLTHQTENRPPWLRGFDIETAAWSLSLRVVSILGAILSIETYLIGFPSIIAIETLTLGLAKALTWYYLSQLARNSSWLAATVASTFSLLATRNPFAQQTDTRALMTVLASFISLDQTLHLLPKQAKARLGLWVLALIPLLPYFANLIAIQLAQSSAIVHVENHPVEVLIREAKVNFESLLRNQSSSYSAAYAEYQRRYGFEPPHGFEEWYHFAVSHQSPIIDEFDMISEGIAPFLRLSGNEVLEIITQVYDEPGHELWSCVVSGQPAKTQCSHHWRTNDRNNVHFFDSIVSQIPSSLDLRFLLNHIDEPTVLIPPPSQQADKPKITNLGGQRSWEALTKYCRSRKHAPSTDRTPPIETYGLPFVTDRKAAMDLCEHAEYSEKHGLLASPESLRLIEGLVPVLSSGAPSTMGDILYPSSAYFEEDRFKYHPERDLAWDQKQNNLYWAGSTTGGHARPSQWRGLHRQRFVELAQHLQARTFTYLREAAGGVLAAAAPSAFLNRRLYAVAFTSVAQCDASACHAQRAYFERRTWASGDAPLRSRLVFDLDGNGISGRFYKLLASGSAPLKQTLLREWHDERLAPWVHYVPVSLGLDELPELVAYLTSTPSGRERTREIAEEGRAWFKRAFREVDVVIYVYRLLLELARLQDPDRPASLIDVG